MADREKVIKEWENVLSRDPLDAPWDLIDETLTLLKEQETVEHAKEVLCKNGWEKMRYPAGTIGKWDDPEIVRCKDCKHGGCRTQKLDGSIFRVVCKKHGTKKNELWMDADWFCADGEVKK